MLPITTVNIVKVPFRIETLSDSVYYNCIQKDGDLREDAGPQKLQTKQSQPVCFISTSKKKKDGLVVEVDSIETKSQELKRLEEHFANTDPKAQKE
ncbi:hypothetical protein KUTeg_021007 [Tegillarca granosa]|uniref:Uncharacterized protein n=1 Tax=Tegillarca granosa TaxID=220873 RepID=A0ABQ9EEU2_TEGGR|nr:hypothetical protein KUTeg_021007 [Tegillarca granosa]